MIILYLVYFICKRIFDCLFLHAFHLIVMLENLDIQVRLLTRIYV